MRAVRTTMTIPPVMQDVAAMLAFVDRQDAVTPGAVGSHGYCMSGPYALAAAARYPQHCGGCVVGTWLVSEAEESPHRSFDKVTGELYRLCRARRTRAAAYGRRTARLVYTGRRGW